MSGPLIVVVMIAAIIVIAVIIYKSISNGENSGTSGSGTLHMSPETISTEEKRHGISTGGYKTPILTGDMNKSSGGSHSVEHIYSCVLPQNIWICAACECENDYSREFCCVCNKQKDWR